MTLDQSADAKHPARFTVEQFHRLCEAVPEQRPELIDGEVLQVIAKGTRHTAVEHRLIAAIQQLLSAHPALSQQLRIDAPLDLCPAKGPIWLGWLAEAMMTGRLTRALPTPSW